MSTKASIVGERHAGLAAACERLVHPGVTEPDARERQVRLIAVMLAAPFLFAAATVQLVGAHLGPAVTLAATCGILAAGWLPALLVATTGSARIAETVAIAVGCAAVGFVTAAAGGPASPLVLMAVVLPVEAFWVARTRRSATVGGTAALVALVAGLGLSHVATGLPAQISGWHWLLPVAYAATLWPRVKHLLRWIESAGITQETPALEVVMNAVVLRMSRAGDVQEASPQAAEVLRVEPAILLGTGLFDRLHVADRVAYLNALADLREGAAARTLAVRLRLPHPDDPRTVRYGNFVVELLDEGAGGRTIAILRDDSENAALKDEVATANERAKTMEVAKSRFLASVSHELRTPLNAIIGFSEILSKNMAGELANERQREYVDLIREAGDHLLAVVNSILDVSKIESGSYEIRPEPFILRDAAELSLSLTRQQAESKGISVSVQIPESPGEVCCDRRAVQQILINLLSNAVKFTPSGGSISVVAACAAGQLDLEVSDTGIGISREDLQNIGQPFMQVQNDYTRQFEGTGLGLALVRGLVALQGGTMSIESAPGAGTSVHVRLPVAEAGAETVSTIVEQPAIATPTKCDEIGHETRFRKTA